MLCCSGLSLAVFRDDNGVPHVLDAYCPHLGADLGAGGQVVGECLQCPFHGWEFSGTDGQCVKIPYANKSTRLRICIRFLLAVCTHLRAKESYS